MKYYTILGALFIFSFGFSQNAPDVLTNQKQVIKNMQLDEEDRYVLNEIVTIHKEARTSLEDAQNIYKDYIEVKNIAKAAEKFEDLKKKAEKKAEKLSFEALYKQLDALEYIEMANDMKFNLYNKLFTKVESNAKMKYIRQANQLIFDASKMYENAKKKREAAYDKGLCKKTLLELHEAEKMEELAIQNQEVAFSLFLDFEYNEEELWANTIYNYLDIPEITVPKTEVSLAQKTNEENISTNDEHSAEKTTEENSNPCPVLTSYKVQVGAFIGKVDVTAFKGVSPVFIEEADNGFTKYLVGEYNSANVAKHALKILRESGFNDAFVVTYRNGKRYGVIKETIKPELADH